MSGKFHRLNFGLKKISSKISNKVNKASITKNLKKWNQTRDLFTDWVANNKIKPFFSENCVFEGFSLWWITKLCNKDNTYDYKWYYELKKNLFEKKKIKYNRSIFFVVFICKLLKNFMRDIFFLIFIKLFSFTRYKKINKTNCFYSILDNLVVKENICYDRLYGHTPLKKNTSKNFYLINIIKHSDFLLNFFKIKKNFNKLNTQHVLINEFISFSELIRIHYITIKSFFKLNFFLQRNKALFKIKNKDCSNVLEPLLLSSFSGDIQISLINAVAIKNFFINKKINFFVSYIEFNPQSRSVYYFLKKGNIKTKSIGYQHSYCNKNVLPYYHRPSEFHNKFNKEGTVYSPSPDYYFVQGLQFKKLLSSYYKKKISVIGSLRYDLTKFKNFKEMSNSKKNILICPSIGDENLIIEFLNGLKDNFYRFILCPHPNSKMKTINLFKKKLSKKINFIISNKSAFENLEISNFVLCGHSSLAFEAMLSNRDSARILSKNYQPIFDKDDGIRNLIGNKKIPFSKLNSIKKFNKIKYLFYKLDNNSYKRFWKNLENIK